MNENKLEEIALKISTDILMYMLIETITEVELFAEGYTLGYIKVLILNNIINVPEAIEIGKRVANKVEKGKETQ
jgi:uncharacterized OB-fold protein